VTIAVGDLEGLKSIGDRHLAASRFEAACEAFEAAASLSELPRGGLRVRLARAHLEAGRPERASDWLMGLVDPAPSFKTWMSGARLLGRCPVETWPAVRRRMRVGLVSTWMTGTFAPLLRLACARHGIALDLFEPPFGQYFNETLDPRSQLYEGELDALILCPDHHALGVRPYSDTPELDVAAEVDRWAGVWEAVRGVAAPVIVQLGFARPGGDPLGHLATGLDGSRRSMVARINAELAHRAAESDVGFVDVGRLARQCGEAEWFEDRSWYVAKIAYGPAAMPVLARNTAAVLAARLGLSRRCLVLDLDNTLWGGVVGDDGVEGITLGNGPDGEAFVDFQVAIKELSQRGVVLAVTSKNDPEVARRPFVEHPEMVLKLDDFAAFVANWGPKSENIRAIADGLGLGLDALTFFDDNPYERAEVRRALPQVDVPMLPDEPGGYRRMLESYVNFEPASFTDGDRARAEQYRARARAEALRVTASSLEEYQASLGMVARIGAIDGPNLARVVQLVNKTNQFNLTTRRRNRAELEAFLDRPEAEGFWVRLADKFADHGLIAVALAEARGEALVIDTLLMSCRVLGRGVEAAILAELAARAAARGCLRLEGSYIPSERNGMVADLYPRLGLAETAREPDGRTTWSAPTEAIAAGPAAIAIQRVDA
jgi:FkbH-like protein